MLQVDEQLLGQAVKQAVGCGACLETGYRDRAGLFELLTVDDTIRGLIIDRAKSGAIKQAARANGMTTLREDAVRKLLAGVATMDDVVRMTMTD